MSVKCLKLSDRLKTVAEFIEDGASVADIGTDHGFLPVYLAQTGLARRIIASDKSAGSLKTALRSADRYGVTDKISFVTAPGLSGVDEADVDTVVIAGVGGERIIEILAGAPWTNRGGVRLILQPQTKIALLRSWLGENGYMIIETKQAFDKGRVYSVILAQGSGELGIRN